jgi:serine protease inhibitor
MKDKTKARMAVICALACAGALAAWTAGAGQAQTLPSSTKKGTTMTTQPTQDKPDMLAASDMATANNKFGFRLFYTISRKDADVNVCVSPTSVALALAITYNGAGGNTKIAMADALALKGMRLEELNHGSQALLRSLSAPFLTPHDSKAGNAAAQLDIANSLWLKREDSLLPDFVQRAQRYYNAQIGDLKGAPQNINVWVAQHTQGKITYIVSAQDVSRGAAVLVNAVYFKGKWNNAFDKALTTDKPFHWADGDATTCKMMAQNGIYNYYTGDTFQMVSLPYQGSRLEMVILLPDAHTRLSALLPRLTPELWQQWIAKMTMQGGRVELPRFRAEYDVELSEALAYLGMGDAFQPHADFSAMSREPLFISKAMHKTFVNVDEQGTEAAAATAVIMKPRSVRHTVPPFQMIMDKPFLYAIRDQKTGALLFLGMMAHP